MNPYDPEGSRMHTPENAAALHSIDAMEHAMHSGAILEARAVLCDSSHDLIVPLPCMRGVIPREEGALGIAEGKTRDIALISRAGKPVCFQILGLERDASGAPYALLSRRAAQQACWDNDLSRCIPGDVRPAKVTHLERFGAFVDIGCGIPSLLPIDCISVSRIAHPRDRFTVGQQIRAVVRRVENGRVHLTHRELLGTWEENAAGFAPGQTVAGMIRSVESYGVFVELTPNLAGLAEPSEQAQAGQCASVYIKAILPEKMKIKLSLIDTFPWEEPPAPLTYFFQGSHMTAWHYAPPACGRAMDTIF